MINVQVNNGEVHVTVEGFTIDLLAEVPIGFGKLLHGLLRNLPDEGLRNELIKGVFECTLDMMKRAGEEE